MTVELEGAIKNVQEKLETTAQITQQNGKKTSGHCKEQPELPRPTHFMRGTEEIWGEDVDPYGVMRTTAADWTDNHGGPVT